MLVKNWFVVLLSILIFIVFYNIFVKRRLTSQYGRLDEKKSVYNNISDIIRSTYNVGINILAPLLPNIFTDGMKIRTRRRLILAGLEDLDEDDFLAGRIMSAIVWLILSLIILYLISAPGALSIIFGVIGFIVPELRLSSLVSKKQNELKGQILDFIVLVASIIAGGGSNIISAMNSVARRMGGEINVVVNKLIADNASGLTLTESLENFAERCGIPEVDDFVRLLTLTKDIGTERTQALMNFTQRSYNSRMLRAESVVNAATIKVVLISVFTFSPALLLLVLTPALMHLSSVLK